MSSIHSPAPCSASSDSRRYPPAYSSLRGNRLKRLFLKPDSTTASLLYDKDATMNAHGPSGGPQVAVSLEALDAINYLRPTNQVILLLQKDVEFPSFPHELTGTIDEKTWYARMDELQKALRLYWHWLEKALFAFAFIASVTIVGELLPPAEDPALSSAYSSGALTPPLSSPMPLPPFPDPLYPFVGNAPATTTFTGTLTITTTPSSPRRSDATTSSDDDQPWPIISAITRYIDQQAADHNSDLDEDNGPVLSDDPLSSSTFSSASASSAASSVASAASRTASALAETATTSARFLLKRQLGINDSDDSDGDVPAEAASTDDSGDVGYGSDGEYYPMGDRWADGYSSDMRWAAIAILIGVLVAVWVPWIVVSVRNNRRLRALLDSWNTADGQLGHMRSLSWSLNKAPAMSNSKILIIGLPSGRQQHPSAFHANAYPPSYGFGYGYGNNSGFGGHPEMHGHGYGYNDRRSGALPDYEGHDINSPYYADHKIGPHDWMAPSGHLMARGPDRMDDDAKIIEVDSDRDEHVRRERRHSGGSGHRSPEPLSPIHEDSEAEADLEREREHARSTAKHQKRTSARSTSSSSRPKSERVASLPAVAGEPRKVPRRSSTSSSIEGGSGGATVASVYPPSETGTTLTFSGTGKDKPKNVKKQDGLRRLSLGTNDTNLERKPSNASDAYSTYSSATVMVDNGSIDDDHTLKNGRWL